MKCQSIVALPDTILQLRIGYALDSFSATYDHLLNAGFSQRQVSRRTLVSKKNYRRKRIYDPFP